MKAIDMKTLAALVTAGMALGMTGCAGMTSGTAAPVKVSLGALHGKMMGGQQPVAGSVVRLYQAGTSGYGAGATELIPGGVVTDAGGNFSLTGAYTCTSGTQLYLTAMGGNPGLPVVGGVTPNNAAIAMMSALGSCDVVPTLSFVNVNELTTVAAAWALTPFLNGSVMGTSATNAAGLAAAVADTDTLVSLSGGVAQPSGAGVTRPTAEINSLGNTLAACVNSAGAGGGGSCDKLFQYTTVSGVAPTNTLNAALNIARNPSVNVSQLLGLATSAAPFQPAINSASDLTIAVTYAGFSQPTAAAVDAGGNLWVADATSVTKLSHAGTVLATATGQSAPSAVALDTAGNVWVTNRGSSSLVELSASGALLGSFTGNGLASPGSLAFDGQGNAWIANAGSVSEFGPSGSALGNYTGGVSTPVAVAVNAR